MRLRWIVAGLALAFAGLCPRSEAAERPRVVHEALTFESGGRVIDVAVFRPNDGGTHPAVIYLHGGVFSFEDPLMVRFNTELASRGLVVLAPHYLLNHTGARHWMATASDAVTFALTLPGVDPDRVGMSGLSMGGQVVLSAAARDRRVKAVAEFFTAWPGTLPDEPVADLPPVLLLNGTADPIIPVDAAFELDGILKARGMPYERQMYRGLGHGFGGGAAFDDAVWRTSAFFGGQSRSKVAGPGSSPGPAGPVVPVGQQPGSGGPILGAGDDGFVAATDGMSYPVILSRKKRRRRPIVDPIAPRSVPSPSRTPRPGK